ncbi:hypothetical protein HN587_06370 [Candidatus Woesearchaeota archaeon]|jgi:hypothetical protein|nr:hypothetical protein [Candidatus Woesearchaeota archaeon]
MFYSATALLAYYNHKINTTIGIHTLTFHALVYYFLIEDKKFEKHFLDSYSQAKDEAEELMNISESQQNAEKLVESYKFESEKRKKFTYEMGQIAKHTKAETSLKRAQEFFKLVQELILK